jgi:hypothetical protein
MTATVKDFTVDLSRFKKVVQLRSEIVMRGAALDAAEALVIGSKHAPGAPGPDTGFLRASFRVGIGKPVDGPTTPDPEIISKHATGDSLPYAEPLDTAAIAGAGLNSEVFVTTSAEYAEYLEDLPRIRRTGPEALRGAPTQFVAPVSASWPRIVRENARAAAAGDL